MCGLCGVLGAEGHWTDGAGDTQVFKDREVSPNRRQERLQRVAISNRILASYGLKLSDWQGTAYVLRNRTGRQEIVPHLAALWPVAEMLAGRPCDPLDPALIADLERAG